MGYIRYCDRCLHLRDFGFLELNSDFYRRTLLQGTRDLVENIVKINVIQIFAKHWQNII